MHYGLKGFYRGLDRTQVKHNTTLPYGFNKVCQTVEKLLGSQETLSLGYSLSSTYVSTPFFRVTIMAPGKESFRKAGAKTVDLKPSTLLLAGIAGSKKAYKKPAKKTPTLKPRLARKKAGKKSSTHLKLASALLSYRFWTMAAPLILGSFNISW